MILVDTSAWIEFDRATGTSIDRRLTQLIADDSDIAVTEPVVMEVLAGATSTQRENDLRRLLQRFSLLRFDPIVDFDAAARIYRLCRSNGVTPRGMIDCMIASVAKRHGASVLSADRDMVEIGRIMGIVIDRAID